MRGRGPGRPWVGRECHERRRGAHTVTACVQVQSSPTGCRRSAPGRLGRGSAGPRRWASVWPWPWWRRSPEPRSSGSWRACRRSPSPWGGGRAAVECLPAAAVLLLATTMSPRSSPVWPVSTSSTGRRRPGPCSCWVRRRPWPGPGPWAPTSGCVRSGPGRRSGSWPPPPPSCWACSSWSRPAAPHGCPGSSRGTTSGTSASRPGPSRPGPSSTGCCPTRTGGTPSWRRCGARPAPTVTARACWPSWRCRRQPPGSSSCWSPWSWASPRRSWPGPGASGLASPACRAWSPVIGPGPRVLRRLRAAWLRHHDPRAPRHRRRRPRVDARSHLCRSARDGRGRDGRHRPFLAGAARPCRPPHGGRAVATPVVAGGRPALVGDLVTVGVGALASLPGVLAAIRGFGVGAAAEAGDVPPPVIGWFVGVVIAGTVVATRGARGPITTVAVAVAGTFLTSLLLAVVAGVGLSSYYPSKTLWVAAALGLPAVGVLAGVALSGPRRRLARQPRRVRGRRHGHRSRRGRVRGDTDDGRPAGSRGGGGRRCGDADGDVGVGARGGRRLAGVRRRRRRHRPAARSTSTARLRRHPPGPGREDGAEDQCALLLRRLRRRWSCRRRPRAEVRARFACAPGVRGHPRG